MACSSMASRLLRVQQYLDTPSHEIHTSNLPFEDWTQVLASERLTGALLDRLTHHVSILTMNGDSYRLKQSAGRRSARRAEQNQATAKTGNQPNAPEESAQVSSEH